MNSNEPKSLFITGAAKRIGKEIAIYLAKKGWNIGLHYHQSHQEALALAKKISWYNVECKLYPANALDPVEMTNQFEKACKQLPNLSLLINNASIFKSDSISNFNTNKLVEQLTINAITPIALMQCLSHQTIKKANIINMLDTRIYTHDTKHLSYSLSKKMLAEATRLASLEENSQIQVNAIAPGAVLPPVESKILEKYDYTDQILIAINSILEGNIANGEILLVDGKETLC